MRKTLLLLSLPFLLNACATPNVVDVKKVGDSNLSCQQIQSEFEEAERFEKEARGERKITGKNVAALVFFWPALIATYSNTEDAITAAKDRKSNLVRLSDSKRCKM